MKKEKDLKLLFMEEPFENYGTLEFKDLKIGDKYIALPVPGDNQRHVGFVKPYYIFEKIDKRDDLRYNSKRLKDNLLTKIPEKMPIIKIE